MAHLYLDSEIANVQYAYSFKKVVSGYSGNCIKVRRSSDNTTSDIGFSGNELDESALTTFLAGSTGYIDTWYDQNSAVNLVQATTADQPELVQIDGVWTAYFDGSRASAMLENGATLTTNTNSSLHVVWKKDVTNTTAYGGLQWGSSDQQLKPRDEANGGENLQFQTLGDAVVATSSLWSDNSWRQHQLQFHNGTVTLFEHTSLIRTASLTSPNMAHFYVGGNNTDECDAYFTEVVWFDDVTDEATLWQVTKNNYQTSCMEYENFIFFHGDSISSGIYPTSGNEWMEVAHKSLGTERWHTYGQGGLTAASAVATFPYYYRFGLEEYMNPTSKSRVAVIFLGTNDIASGAAFGTTVYNSVVELARSYKDVGFGAVIALTMLPRTETGVVSRVHATERATFNTLLKANTTDFDLVVDLSTNPNLEDETNSTYFQADEIHLTTAGAAEIASTYQAALTAAGFNFSGHAVERDITFVVQGDQIDAKRSFAGKTGSPLGTKASVTTDEPGLNGVSTIDLGASTTYQPISYVGGHNTPSCAPRSLLLRAKFPSYAANGALFFVGGNAGQNTEVNTFCAYINTSKEILFRAGNDLGQQTSRTSAAVSALGTTNFHDLLFMWTGNDLLYGMEVWVDGKNYLRSNSAYSMNSYYTNLVGYDERARNASTMIMLGTDYQLYTSRMFIDEAVFFEGFIDPFNVPLADGSIGPLNGNSRTEYVDFTELDGLALTGGKKKISTGTLG